MTKIQAQWKADVGHIPWKVGAVVGVDNEIMLSIDKTLGDCHSVGTTLLQYTQEFSEHQPRSFNSQRIYGMIRSH